MRSLILALILAFACPVFTAYAAPPQKSAQTRKRKSSGKKTTTTKPAAKTTKPANAADARKRQQAAQQEIKLTEQQIRENENKVKKSLSELGKLDQEISKTTANINSLSARVNQLSGEISVLETGIGKNEEELSRLREEYLKAVKKMRVTKKNKSSLAFIFSSKSLSQASRRMRYLREFSDWRNRQTEQINSKIADLKNQKEALAKAKEEQQNALSLQQSSKNRLAVQHSQQEALVAELKQNGKALDAHLKQKQAEATELGNLVSQLIAEEQRKAAEEEARRKAAQEEARRKAAEEESARLKAQEEEKESLLAMEQPTSNKDSKKKEPSKSKNDNKKTSKTEEGKSPSQFADARKRAPRGNKTENSNNTSSGSNSVAGTSNESASDFVSMRGRLSYPVTGSFAVTSPFGRQHLPDLPNVEYDNPGIDAESDAGASARAVFKGKVSGVYLLPGYNTVVIVNHGNYYTVYGNISSPSVKIGDSVDAGTNLGLLSLNDEDRSHSSIHFEVWKNREKLNPLDWLH